MRLTVSLASPPRPDRLIRCRGSAGQQRRLVDQGRHRCLGIERGQARRRRLGLDRTWQGTKSYRHGTLAPKTSWACSPRQTRDGWRHPGADERQPSAVPRASGNGLRLGWSRYGTSACTPARELRAKSSALNEALAKSAGRVCSWQAPPQRSMGHTCHFTFACADGERSSLVDICRSRRLRILSPTWPPSDAWPGAQPAISGVAYRKLRGFQRR